MLSHETGTAPPKSLGLSECKLLVSARSAYARLTSRVVMHPPSQSRSQTPSSGRSRSTLVVCIVSGARVEVTFFRSQINSPLPSVGTRRDDNSVRVEGSGHSKISKCYLVWAKWILQHQSSTVVERPVFLP